MPKKITEESVKNLNITELLENIHYSSMLYQSEVLRKAFFKKDFDGVEAALVARGAAETSLIKSIKALEKGEELFDGRISKYDNEIKICQQEILRRYNKGVMNFENISDNEDSRCGHCLEKATNVLTKNNGASKVFFCDKPECQEKLISRFIKDHSTQA